jgi:drug/metabolite transporter (DMT)-like permease
VVAITLGILVLAERIALLVLAGIPLILAGVAFNRSREPVSPGAGRPQAIRKGLRPWE